MLPLFEEALGGFLGMQSAGRHPHRAPQTLELSGPGFPPETRSGFQSLFLRHAKTLRTLQEASTVPNE